MTNSIFDELKATNRLPSPTGVALEILRLADAETTTPAQMARVVESDPAIASRLLKLVNSSFSGLPRSVASVLQAVTLLGLQTVKSVALGFSLISAHRDGHCRTFDYERFWSESLARAVTMRRLAGKVNILAPDEGFTCGLLGRIGRLALTCVFPKEYADVLYTIGSDDENELAEAEAAVFRIRTNDLSAEMITEWGIPDIFCDALRAEVSPEESGLQPGSRAFRIARMLRLSVLQARVLVRTTTYRDELSTLTKKAYRLGIDPVDFASLFEATTGDWREAGSILSIATRNVPPMPEIYALAADRRSNLEPQPAPPPSTETVDQP